MNREHLDHEFNNLRRRVGRAIECKDFKRLAKLRDKVEQLKEEYNQLAEDEEIRLKVPKEARRSYKLDFWLERLRHLNKKVRMEMK